MRAAVVADAVHILVVDDRTVVHIVNVDDVYVVDRAIVVKIAAMPISTCVAETGVAEAVVNAAVKSDSRSPVACVPVIQAG
jgi:hypothetical protein